MLIATRAGLLLLFFMGVQARADAPGPVFREALAANVFTTALSFMEPRILEPTPVSTLSFWGLHGLSALDPAFAPEMDSARLRLIYAGRILADTPRPAEGDPALWGAAVARLFSAAWGASPAIRRTGTQGAISSFFDEVFNHLDPYSRYRTPQDAAKDRAGREGEIGTGLTLARRGGVIVVKAVAAGGPADESGLKPGTRILAIGGQDVAGQTVRQVQKLLTGPEGMEFALTVQEPGGATEDITLRCGIIPPDTVFVSRKPDLLVLRITAFERGTGSRVAAALTRALEGRHRPRGIVLDLRGNRGGLLSQAVAAAGALLEDGALVATTAGRDPAADHVWQSEGGDLAEGLPVIVVVDGRSASAAEILAAALADDRRAVVVGSTTLGKGLVQTIRPLPDGGLLYLTWSRVLAPLGWPIQGLGVMPQVCTSRGQANLESALQQLAAGFSPMQEAVARSRAARAPVPLAQILDIRSACPAAEGQEADIQAARFLVERPDAYSAALLPAMLNLGAAP